MPPSSRGAQFTKLHKTLKKHYRPVASVADRPVLEHLLFACCLENAHYSVAEEAFAALPEAFFDWNEMRVSSVRELAEVMARLPDPPGTADRFKRILQHVFEDSYSFDLEGLRKKNLGPVVEALGKIDGVTPFAVAYVVQAALGGHSIPLDAGTLEVLRILGLASEEDIASGVVAGLERAIPKRSGVEFGSLLHQLGADFTDNPFAADLRERLLEIEPTAKGRLPKRTRKKAAAETAPAAETVAGPETAKAAAKKEAESPAADAGAKPAKKKTDAKDQADEAKLPTKRKTLPAKKDSAPKTKPQRDAGRKKTAAAGISKRKPR